MLSEKVQNEETLKVPTFKELLELYPIKDRHRTRRISSNGIP